MGFRPLSTRALRTLELRDLNPVDTSWLAFNYYIKCDKYCTRIVNDKNVCGGGWGAIVLGQGVTSLGGG